MGEAVRHSRPLLSSGQRVFRNYSTTTSKIEKLVWKEYFRLLISAEAHLVFSVHAAVDGAQESSLAANK